MGSSGKSISFIQHSLRSALDIYRGGGHVTDVFKDRLFRMHYDNRRLIIVPKDQEDYFENSDVIDYSNILLDSKPLKTIKECMYYRYFSSLHKKIIYQKNNATSGVKSKYISYLELAIRNFLVGLMNNQYNLDYSSFHSYKEIVNYIHNYNDTSESKSFKISPNMLSKLKRKKINIKKSVPKTIETIEFVDYVKVKFPRFDEDSFFKLSKINKINLKRLK